MSRVIPPEIVPLKVLPVELLIVSVGEPVEVVIVLVDTPPSERLLTAWVLPPRSNVEVPWTVNPPAYARPPPGPSFSKPALTIVPPS